jgi:ferrochelatase
LTDALGQMVRDGVRRALAFVTSAYSSHASCRQYLENIEQARKSAGPAAPQIDKLRAFFNHPSFIEATVGQVRAALNEIPIKKRSTVRVLYTAHSIPTVMAAASAYAQQLQETADLVSQALQHSDYQLVFQSRSGPPQQPWLEPDILDALREVAQANRTRDVVIAPIGFLSDHIEILWDLDTEARQLCDQLGLNMVRAKTVGSDPQFVGMIRELILERVGDAPRRSLGKFGASHDVCPTDCCAWSPPVRRDDTPSPRAGEGGEKRIG